ncbi:hypothetical protein [Gryllotalpicola protaetiae]|uniref:hypothetical protein n=1 Tax=Gryllotalpicola protaetiae TaxID=2419771 RepID=UPI0013C50C73|nr:hypothetical protein [Gryllotalpicola protaetiae]
MVAVMTHILRRSSIAGHIEVGGGLKESNARVDQFVDYLFWFGIALGYAVVVLRERLLPMRFSLDGLRIQAIAQGIGSAFGDKSFGNIAGFYRWLHLGDKTLLAGILGYSAFVLLAILVRTSTRRLAHAWYQGVVYFLAFFFAAVFLGFYSKDVLVLPILALVLFSPARKRWDFVILGSMVLYANWFRSYWYLVALVYLIYRLARIDRWRLRSVLIGIAFTIAVVSIGLSFVLHVDPDHFRTMVNDAREDSLDAQSAIPSYVSIAQPFGGVINNVLTGAFLVVPIPLLLSGGLYYVALTFALTALWILIGFSHRSRGRIGAIRMNPPRYARAFCILAAFVVVQALFEPDYGSALRHVTPVLLAGVLICSYGVARHEASQVNERAGMREIRPRDRRVRQR